MLELISSPLTLIPEAEVLLGVDSPSFVDSAGVVDFVRTVVTACDKVAVVVVELYSSTSAIAALGTLLTASEFAFFKVTSDVVAVIEKVSLATEV